MGTPKKRDWKDDRITELENENELLRADVTKWMNLALAGVAASERATLELIAGGAMVVPPEKPQRCLAVSPQGLRCAREQGHEENHNALPETGAPWLKEEG